MVTHIYTKTSERNLLKLKVEGNANSGSFNTDTKVDSIEVWQSHSPT